MIRNYFKVAWRNLWKHTSDSIINIIGLCIAFTCALLLILSVAYEFSFDRFHANAKNIYHVYFKTRSRNRTDLSNAMPAPLLPALKAGYPQVINGSRYMGGGTFVQYKSKKLSKNLTYADPDFFKMFSLPLKNGSANSAIKELNDIVLSKNTAIALFGNDDPIGKTVELQWQGGWKPFTVRAVSDEQPQNSNFNFDLVIRFEAVDFYPKIATAWDSHFHDVYIQLKDGTDKKSFEAKLPAFVQQYMKGDIDRLKRDGVQPAADGSYISLLLQPLSDLHINTEIGGASSININYLYLLTAIAVLILTIACINFINLSIGKSFTRSKEIGLRKTMGALQTHITVQFWGEALLICSLSFLVSIALTYFLLPSFKLLFAMNIQQKMLASPAVWLFILAGFIVVTLIAGGYPAWIMARLNIVEVLKGKLSMNRSNRLRNALITFQFIIAILLISCTMIAWQQVHYLRTKPLGYNTSQVISIPVTGEIEPTQALSLMRIKLASSPLIASVTGIYDNLGTGADQSSRTSVMGFDYKNREIKSNWMGISYDFVKTLDLQLADGRDFSKEFLTDSNAVLINEEMAKEIGEKKIVGIKLPVDSAKPLTVIGVVKNFNFKSLKQKIDPLTLVLDKNFSINYILIKVRPEQLNTSMNLVRSTWKSLGATGDFLGSFLDENVNRQYKREEKLVQIFVTGGIIAVALSCMGLLAMAILVISQRKKEIGVRKVLGATVSRIVFLIAKDFLILVLVGTIIATPIAWYAMHQWLQAFEYRIGIGWYIFISAGLLALIVALITVGIQAMRAALVNPVTSLRAE